jgi:DNA (cytosine-5)-methyltransferase 1
MTHASLFSGIGGFDLAAEWAGWTNAFNCEIDPFCRKVLKYHFPNAEQYEDIRATDFTVWKDRIDVLTGGFPCQPFSLAGKRRGTEDDRYLWPAMLDVIRTVRPRWVVGENVYGIVNWSEGLVFEQVCREDGFYAVEPVARPDGDRRRKRPNEQKPLPECVGTSDAGNGVENGIVAYFDRQRCEECNASCQSGHTQRTTQNSDAKRRIPDWNGFPTQPPVCGGDDGFPGELAGIAFPRWRREAVKACGNAIVPQVALRIFETINEYEKI